MVPGAADGELLYSDVGLSFMGGVDPSTGRVIDTHHPLHGQSVAGKVLALPSGRGSCSGSATLFELLLNGQAPAALIFAPTSRSSPWGSSWPSRCSGSAFRSSG